MKLRGFFVSISCPTEAYFQVRIDCSDLNGPAYLNLVRELQDLLAYIDELYAKRDLERRSRSLKARYQRISADERRRIITFFPIPSSIVNAIRYQRHKLYQALSDNAVTLEIVRMGNHKENVYIMPPENAEKFLAEVDSINRKLKEIASTAQRFDKGEIELLLSRYNLDLPPNSVDFPDIRVDLTPITFTGALEEWASKSPRVRELLERKERELVKSIGENLKKRLEPSLKEIERLTQEMLSEKELSNIKIRLERLRNLTAGLGFTELSADIKLLLDSIDSYDPDAILKAKAGVEGRISSLFQIL